MAVDHPSEANGLTEAAVEFKDVGFAWDDHVVLRDVSFRLPRGGMSVLLGASGTGKSLILKLILGLLKPDTGVGAARSFEIHAPAGNDFKSSSTFPGSTAVIAFRALAAFDAGRAGAAVADLVDALLAHSGDPDGEAYRAALHRYAAELR